MGEVYEALDVALSETVALKTLTLSSTDEPGAADRLLGEVRLARKVTHPNVCRILEFGVHRTSEKRANVIPFLTMELLRGETLARAIVRAGRLSEELALKLLREVVSGLEAVHATGIVHRDLKSENVFLSTSADGWPRAIVMDFGLARVQRPREDSKTSTGPAVVGTLDYMAPEQIEGKRAMPSSDVYALGVIAFEMLTGRLPHAGQTQFARAAAKLVEDAPRPSAEVKELGAGWDALIRRCLERNPTKRPDLRELARALDRMSTPGRRVKQPLLAAIFCSAVTVLVVGAGAGVRHAAHGQERPALAAAARAAAPTVAAPRESAPPRFEIDELPPGPNPHPMPRTRRDRARVRRLATGMDDGRRDRTSPPAAEERPLDRNDGFALPQAHPVHPDDLINPFAASVTR